MILRILLLYISFIVSTHAIYSMDLSLSYKKPIESEIVQKYVQKFPYLTLKAAELSYKKQSEHVRAQIDQQFISTKNDLLLITFHLATRIPRELHRPIFQNIFHDNKNATEKFLSLPIRDSYLLYVWSKNVFNGKTGIASSLKINSLDCIFELSDEIKQVKKIIKQANNNHHSPQKFYVKKNDMHLLSTMIKNSSNGCKILNKIQLPYLSREKITIQDYKEAVWKPTIISGTISILLLVAGLSRFIEKRFCEKVIDSSQKQTVFLIEDLTEIILRLEKPELLAFIAKKEDYLRHTWISLLAIHTPFLATMPILSTLEYYYDKRISRETFFASIGTNIGIYLLSCIPTEEFPGGLPALVATITSIVFLGFYVLFYLNTKTKYYNIAYPHEIDALLKNKAIIISD